jgi:hypothetical protein
MSAARVPGGPASDGGVEAVASAAAAPRLYVPGIGEPLPAGERLLWSGQPERGAVARHVCQVRKILAYFGLLVAFVLAGAVGSTTRETVTSLALLGGMAATVLAFALVYASLVARTSVYAITDRRVVLRIGVAIPAVLNIPFDRIASVDLRAGQRGTGDVVMALTGGARLAYLLLWPHARPWRLAQPQPAFRGIPDAAHVGTLLAEAVAAHLAAADRLDAEAESDDATDPQHGAADLAVDVTPRAAHAVAVA